MIYHFFPLLFPKDSESLNILDIWLREKGAKKTVKRYLKSGKSEEKKTILKQKCSYLRPLLSITFPQGFWISNNIVHPTLGSWGKKTVKRYLKGEKNEEKNFFLRGDFRQFSNKNVHIWDHFFPLLFPKDSKSLKILDIRFREVGAKRPLNSTSKVNTQTHRRKFWLIKSIGPEGRCFENPAYGTQSISRPMRIGDIASLCINLSPKTVQFSPPIFGQFCEKLIFFFPPKYLRLPVLTKYFVKKIVCVLRKGFIFVILT